LKQTNNFLLSLYDLYLADYLIINYMRQGFFTLTLKRFLLIILVFLSFNLSTKASIVYTNITPHGNPGILIFNADTISLSDDGLLLDYDASSLTNIYSNGTASNNNDDPKALFNGFSIGSGGNFIGDGEGSVNNYGSGITFPYNTVCFIGVRLQFIASGPVYYGWIRVKLTNTNGVDSVTYYDYAYNNIAGQAILAGDNGMTRVLVSSINVHGKLGATTITTMHGTLQMIDTVFPSNATVKTVSWKVGDTLGTITQYGLLTAKYNGVLKVIAVAEDGTDTTDLLILLYQIKQYL